MHDDLPIPLERLTLPDQLDGRYGSNRAGAETSQQLAADNDLDAIRAWLDEFADSPRTQRHYRKEAERLLLWSLLVCHTPLSGLTREDCRQYQTFLADPQPQSQWCGPRAPRFSERWRPFAGPLSPASQRTALLVLNSLFSYLVEAGYLAGNPLSLMRRRQSVQPEPQVERYLEQDQWQALLTTLDTLPQDTYRERCHYERTRFLVTLLYLMSPRISEVAGHSMGSFRQLRGRWWWQVTGKGGRTGRVPVNQQMLAALQRYRQFMGLTPLPYPDEQTPLILSLGGKKAIGDNMIYRIIKDLLGQAAERTADTDPVGAERLRRASTHWFRHTSITHQAGAGIELDHLRRNARHARMETTGLYLHSEEADWHQAMERHRMPDPES